MERHDSPGNGQEAQDDDAEANYQLIEDTKGDGDGAITSTGSRGWNFAFPAAASTSATAFTPVRHPIPDTGYSQLIPDDGDRALIESVSNRVLASAQGFIDLHDVFISWQQRLEKILPRGTTNRVQTFRQVPRQKSSRKAFAPRSGLRKTTAIMDGMKQRGIKKCLMPLKPVPVEEDEESSAEIDVEKLVRSKNPKPRGVDREGGNAGKKRKVQGRRR